MDQNCTIFSHLIISVFLISLFSFSLCSELCDPNDKNALLQIKNQFGDQWFPLWDPNTDCCNDWSEYWYVDGTVNCDNKGRVIELSIDGFGFDRISSEIPSILANLTSLRTLKLYNIPKLYGPIPPALGKLTNLSSLTLAYANLSGPIPTFICNLTNLWSLEIGGANLIRGPIPKCLGQLKNLRQLSIYLTSLTSHIPPTIVQLPNLQWLDLMSNKLFGPIPDFPTQTNYIYFIRLSNNMFSGTIPTSLGLLSNLTVLFLSGNQLNGSIPSSLGHVSSLRYLDLSWNRLTGSIPESFGSLTPSIELRLQNNRLTGPIPKSLGQLDTMSLDLSNNRLTGDALFLFTGDKSWTETIFIQNNSFKFNFSNVDQLPFLLRFLNISHNKIYGSLPKQLCSQYVLSLDVSYNGLCGPIPVGCEHFGPSSFAHNKCLCGSPIAAACK